MLKTNFLFRTGQSRAIRGVLSKIGVSAKVPDDGVGLKSGPIFLCCFLRAVALPLYVPPAFVEHGIATTLTLSVLTAIEGL